MLFLRPFILLVEDDYMYISPFNAPLDILRMCKTMKFYAESFVVVPRGTVKELQQEKQEQVPDLCILLTFKH